MKMDGEIGPRKRAVLNMLIIIVHYIVFSFVKVTKNLQLENFVKIFYCFINIKVLHHTLKKKFLSYTPNCNNVVVKK